MAASLSLCSKSKRFSSNSNMKLNELLQRLRAARHPEDVFDPGNFLAGDIGLKEVYRDFAKIVHPDLVKTKAGKKEAEEGFKLLRDFYAMAEIKMREGHWGDRTWMKAVVLKTKKDSYTLTRRLPGGDISNVYVGANVDPFVLKICRSPANNDLLDNEREILTHLWTNPLTSKLRAMTHIVKFNDSFELAVGPVRKRVNVCYLANAYHSLAEVKAAYPDGIDMRDSAWMFNRILGAVLIAQQAGVRHNAILPEHVLIHVGKHNAKLCGWSYAAKGVPAPVTAIVSRYRDFYPMETLSKRPTTTASDLYMAAKTIMHITNPDTIPRNIAGLLKTCFLAQRNRPQDSWGLFKEFGVELEAAFGPKVFRPFVMPTASIAVL